MMKNAVKWISGLGVLALGAAVMAIPLPTLREMPLPMVLAEEDSGSRDGLGGNGEYKYNVRRGMYQQEGGADHHVKPGRYAQPQENG